MYTVRVAIDDEGKTTALASIVLATNVGGSTSTLDIEQKSQTIKEKLAILKLCSRKQDLHGIGKKLSDSVFYVRCTPEEMIEVFGGLW